jgi:hypothetical protein
MQSVHGLAAKFGGDAEMGACVLAIGKGFSYFGQNCCTLLRAAQEVAGSKRSLLRPDWRGM